MPIERLAELEPAPPMAPTFVFSISRCGSTLLSALLRHVGHPAASEPDLYTQMAGMPADERARIGDDGRRTLIRGCTAALARQIGPDVVVKLRDHCNDIAGLMAQAVPEARMAMMLRDRLGWAASRHRAFEDSAQALADILKRGVMTYDALVRGGHAPVLIWYEDLVRAPGDCLARLGVPAARLPGGPDGFAAVLSRDAQDGTTIGRRGAGAARLPEALARDFESIWAAISPRDVLRRHGLQRLLPPGG